jgi:prepilin-type processing-associated H-X9-DG protein
MRICKSLGLKVARRRGVVRLEGVAALLVLLLVFLVLAFIVAASTMRVGKRPVWWGCRNNLRQVYAGLFSYSRSYEQYFPGRWNGYVLDQAQGSQQLIPAYAREDLFPPSFDVNDLRGDDDLSPLFAMGYVADIRVFNCPTTTDRAEPERLDESGKPLPKGYDIMFKATERRYTSVAEYRSRKGSGPTGQLSYEYLGEVAPSLLFRDINGQLAWLAHDIDERGLEAGKLDWVIDGDNHATGGGNVLFLDGRVEWVKAEGWTQTIRAGHDERLMAPDATNRKLEIPPGAVPGEWDRATGWPDPR